jgi:hypothetical protein
MSNEKTNTQLTNDVSLIQTDISVINTFFAEIDPSGNFTLSKEYIDASLAPFATNVSVGLALGAFSTNASVNTALGAFATNASVNTADFIHQIDISVLDTSMYFITSDGSIWSWKVVKK